MDNCLKPEICQDQHFYFERLNYYFGKMMTVRDFQDDQKYFNEKRSILNLFGIGWGVLCGLKVEPDPDRTSHVIVQPGFALDQNGNEIMICKPQIVNLSSVEGQQPITSPPTPSQCFIYLEYKECLAEPSPIPVEECEEMETECVYNRTRETFKLSVSYDEPHLPDLLDQNIKDKMHCVVDCIRFMQNPIPVIIEKCPDRKPCQRIPLARVWYSEDSPPTELNVDNNVRKVVYSNEVLYQLIQCLEQELWKVHAAHYDRRRNVPSLAQTIRGLNYKNGKLYYKTGIGIHPSRITTDGTCIWITDPDAVDPDSKLKKIIRIDREDFTEINEPKILLPDKSWGIAFDGHYMWVTHPESSNCKITGINICDITDRIVVSDLPGKPEEIIFDGRFLWVSHHIEGNHYLSKIDPAAHQFMDKFEIGSGLANPIKSMAFDGHAIWIIYDDAGLRKINVMSEETGEPIDPEPLNPIRTPFVEPNDIIFDGSHIWVSNKSGVSKFKLQGDDNAFLWTSQNQRLTAASFDGRYVWATDINDCRLYRIDIFSEENDQGYLEIGMAENITSYEVSRICFDGSFLWIAGTGVIGNNHTGIIHRLLP